MDRLESRNSPLMDRRLKEIYDRHGGEVQRYIWCIALFRNYAESAQQWIPDAEQRGRAVECANSGMAVLASILANMSNQDPVMLCQEAEGLCDIGETAYAQKIGKPARRPESGIIPKEIEEIANAHRRHAD